MELRLLESYKRRGDDEDGSAAEALSPRPLPDLDEDDSACEEELARLAAQVSSTFSRRLFADCSSVFNSKDSNRYLKVLRVDFHLWWKVIKAKSYGV